MSADPDPFDLPVDRRALVILSAALDLGMTKLAAYKCIDAVDRPAAALVLGPDGPIVVVKSCGCANCLTALASAYDTAAQALREAAESGIPGRGPLH